MLCVRIRTYEYVSAVYIYTLYIKKQPPIPVHVRLVEMGYYTRIGFDYTITNTYMYIVRKRTMYGESTQHIYI